MKYLTILLILLLAGCGGIGDLPPTPPPPGESRATMSTPTGSVVMKLPRWAAAPSTGFSLEPNSVVEGRHSVTLKIEGEEYVHKNFYLYKDGRWRKKQFDQSAIRKSSWIGGEATVTVEEDWKAGKYPFIVFACSKSSGKWNCHNNKWIMQILVVEAAKPEITFQSSSVVGAVQEVVDEGLDVKVRLYDYGAPLKAKGLIKNVGHGIAAAHKSEVRLKREDGTVKDYSIDVPVLPPGSEHEIEVELNEISESPGLWQIEFVDDTENVVNESIEGGSVYSYIRVDEDLPAPVEFMIEDYCEDSDGLGFDTQGITTYSLDGLEYEHTDTCTYQGNEMFVEEGLCEVDTFAVYSRLCENSCSAGACQ